MLYARTLNGAESATRAGYSPRCAAQKAVKLLQEPKVRALVDQVQAEQRQRSSLTADRILEELRRVGLSDLRQVFDQHGNLRPIHEWDDSTAAGIASVEVVMKNAAAGDGKVDRVLKIKLWDKTKALNDLARHFALLTDVVQVSGDVTLSQRIALARARGAQLLETRAPALLEAGTVPTSSDTPGPEPDAQPAAARPAGDELEPPPAPPADAGAGD